MLEKSSLCLDELISYRFSIVCVEDKANDVLVRVHHEFSDLIAKLVRVVNNLHRPLHLMLVLLVLLGDHRILAIPLRVGSADIHQWGARFPALPHHCDDTERYKPGGSQTCVPFWGYGVDDSQHQAEGPHLQHDLEENVEAPSPFHWVLEEVISPIGVSCPVQLCLDRQVSAQLKKEMESW